MTKDDFCRALEADLLARNIPYDRFALRRFVDKMWPLLWPKDEPRPWANAYLIFAGQKPPA